MSLALFLGPCDGQGGYTAAMAVLFGGSLWEPGSWSLLSPCIAFSLRVSVVDWASLKLTDSRVAAYVESSLHPTSPFQLFLSHENF